MRQRNGRQKFHDLRLLTFQDWIVPHYNSHRKVTNIMKNGRLPVFTYTKMDNGPPLSPISSQFAWAGHGHVLPDLVQEQSDRLLKRLERPRTADGRISRIRHNPVKNGLNSRPVTAVPTRKRASFSTPFKVDGQKYELTRYEDDNNADGACNIEMMQEDKGPISNVFPKRCTTESPVSERSNSPDFIANLYKEYEMKIASESTYGPSSDNHGNDPLTPPVPPTKLLRKPNPRPRIGSKNTTHKNTSSQTSPPATEKIVHVHCVVKLPSDQNDVSSEDNVTLPRHTADRAKSRKPDTWLDLSEVVQLSDDDDPNGDPDGLREPRPSLASDTSCSVKLTDIPSEVEDVHESEKKPKSKPARPSSSKSFKRVHNKSKTKKRRPHSSVEESKESRKPAISQTRNCDKLREEIETQMSKLDFDNTVPRRSYSKNIPLPKPPPRHLSAETANNISSPKPAPKVLSAETRPRSCRLSTVSEKSPTFTDTSSFFTMKGAIPLKKVPIQILTDPFSSTFKVYHGHDYSVGK